MASLPLYVTFPAILLYDELIGFVKMQMLGPYAFRGLDANLMLETYRGLIVGGLVLPSYGG